MINKNKATTSNKTNKPAHYINEQIRVNRFILIDENSQNKGEVSLKDALNYANNANLDLVLINYNKENPSKSICKVLDYSKYLYEQKKKAKDNKSAPIKTKILKVNVQTALNDLNWNTNNCLGWLQDKNSVKIMIKANGRFAQKPELVYDMYDKIINLLAYKCGMELNKNNSKDEIIKYVTDNKIAKENKASGFMVKQHLKKINPFLYEAVIEPNKQVSKMKM